MTIAHLVVITGGYPSPASPTHLPFVQQFAHAVARQGVRCTVIHPVAFHKCLKENGFPYQVVERLPGGETVVVFRPRFFSLSSRRGFEKLGPLNPGLFSLHSFKTSVSHTIIKQNLKPDALYGHFLYLAGVVAVQAGYEMGIPSFPCVGEGEFWTVAKYGKNRAKKDIKNSTGFLANSTLLKKMLCSELDITCKKVGVFPNGIDEEIFYRRDRAKARKAYSFPEEIFLVSCVGNHLLKKGPCRVAEAIDGIEGIGGVFVGQGPVPPQGDNILFNQRVTHDKVPELLSASDVFVLPTLIEGSSNAIVEAMACGLPIISSEGEFNDDLLSDDMSIRVDPMNIAEIRAAILTLRNDNLLREKMSRSSLSRSKKFNINERARNILSFMEEKKNSNE